ncbi:MAG: hypothetical protein WBP38_05975 [Hyphomicrobium sp.]|nr:hypothetical protein [Hyphomicrobium sp.]
MTDDTKDRRSGGQTATPVAATSGVKRPYATLDLKATEIKITPVSKTTQSYAATAARGSTVPKADASKTDASKSDASTSSQSIPLPLTPQAYVTSAADTAAASASSATSSAATATAKSAAGNNGSSTATKAASAASGSSTASPANAEPVVVHKRGGFFSHLAAGVIGGILALSGAEWALPQLGIHGTTSRLADDTAAIGQRLQVLEKTKSGGADLAPVEERLAALEKSVERIPAIAESQSRLVAETKAALASAAGDTGMPEQLSRITTLEERLKALTDAGANNPNAGRLEQLAALTGKVADLETSLATQLTALRKDVADDVDARVASVAASAEAAKAGTQRLDKDVAGVKSEEVVLTERITALKADNDHLNAAIKLAKDETSALKAALETVQSTSAKPTDVAAAVKPVDEKVSALEQSVQSLVKGEDDRRANSERIVLSLELQNLKRALDGGQPYAPELAAVAKVSDGKFDLGALEKFKDEGVPPVADLAANFRKIANDAIDADTEPAEGSVMDRLIAGAKSVVRVRKANHAPDDKSTEAIVGRMETAVKEGRLADVLTEAKDLSPKALVAAQSFLDRVSARVSVDTAVGAIEKQLKTSLSAAPADTSTATP